MNITAEITGIKYKVIYGAELAEVDFNNLDINTSKTYFLLSYNKSNYGVSKWKSPKRSRSYPFERVYNTFNTAKKITVIPIIKDEGLRGDRDFIQWDTVSLMSLLDIYVIFAYYHKAAVHNSRDNKISKQEFDNNYVKNKIDEINNYKSSALHWNLKEIKDTLPAIIDLVQTSYSKISGDLSIKMHSDKGIAKFKKQFENGVADFMSTSRDKAKKAQSREMVTIQPKEHLTTATKATITIKNYLGGEYYLTTDEILIDLDKLYLIEGKHTKELIFPSKGDIKDGLLKMVLYTNLINVKINNVEYIAKPVLKLTSINIIGCITSHSSEVAITKFIKMNKLKENIIDRIDNVFKEAKENNFEVRIEGV
jgi:hypothetical protein